MPRKKHSRNLIIEALEDAKARDLAVLDVRKICDFTDYMVVASGTSNRHVVSIADKVMEKMTGQRIKPSGVEGMENGDWVLLDYGEVVVHVMRPQTRDFYNLEKLWSDAKPVARVHK
jgi:ribosome-associated protein